jgi:tight adherence protein B
MTILPLFLAVILLLSAAVVMAVTRPSQSEKEIRSRIADIRNPRRSLLTDTGELELGDDAAGTLIQRLDNYIRRYSFSTALETLILEADSETTVGSLLLKSAALLPAFGLAGLLLTRSMPSSVVLGSLGFALPIAILRFRRSKRLKAATAALPDTADLLARSLRAGNSMTQALEVLAQQAPQPLAAEFSRVFQRQKLGVALREVLLDLGRRIPSKDLQFLITAILVQRETGGDLVEILDHTAKTLRERIRVQGEVRIHTAQGRLTGWILSLLPVGLLGAISLFSPGYCSILFTDPVGRLLLYGGGGCILLGGLTIRQIVRVKF